jgi:MtrB/PioB family decaheme-associated outer membrane protein
MAAVCLLTPAIYAQDLEEEAEELAPVYASEIEIGVGYVSEDSHRFGKFNGLEEQGAFFIGNLDIRKNRPAGDETRDYWELSGTNLGLDTRNAYAEYTREGSFSAYFDYDERVNNLIDDGVTPFRGKGSSRLTLPDNWIPGSGVGSLPLLIPSLHDITIEKDRQKVGGGISWDLTDRWGVTANYHHEEKDGVDEFGAVFGTSGGNPRASILPIPHQFDFDEFDIGVSYKGYKAQFTLTYNLSLFDNQIKSLIFDNPYNNSQWHPAARSLPGALVQGQIGNVFPDNEAWSVNFSGGYNLTRNTRVTANISYGEMTQDETFLPYTIIPALQATITNPLPRSNLDGEIVNTYVNLNLTHRFNSKLDAKARFTYDDRDNNTPRDVYIRIAGDAQAQPTWDPATGDFSAGGNARYNRPYSLERMKFEFEGGYRLPYMSRLTAGYTYEEKDRDLQEVDTTEEHSFHVKLNTMPAQWVSGWGKYTYRTREAAGDNGVPGYYRDVLAALAAAGIPVDPRAVNVDDYFNNLPFLEGHAPELVQHEVEDFLAAPGSGAFYGLFFENDPLMRKYYMADRDRNEIAVNVNFYLSEALSFGILGRYYDDDYDNSPTGLQENNRGSLSFDAVYAPSDKFSANLFFTVERNDYEQRGFERAGPQNVTVPEPDRIAMFGNNFYRYDVEDHIYTTGAGFEAELIEDKFNVSLDLIFSDARTEIVPSAEDFPASTRLPEQITFPDVDTTTFSIKWVGDYKYKEGWGARLYYWYEWYDSTDFALDRIETATLARGGTGGNVILLGNQAPDYTEHVVGFTIYHQF